jgi:ribosomal protein S18 acetylase RimI-like enzyme
MPGAASASFSGGVACARMTAATRPAAARLLGQFLGADPHYRASASAYGDGGAQALERALELFLARPEIGFVWLATRAGTPAGACVVCYAISTSRGAVVAKLDDVTIDAASQRQGVGSAMLAALIGYLRAAGIGRIDTSCHRTNGGAWRFYERHGFRPLEEERIALVL